MYMNIHVQATRESTCTAREINTFKSMSYVVNELRRCSAHIYGAQGHMMHDTYVNADHAKMCKSGKVVLPHELLQMFVDKSKHFCEIYMAGNVNFCLCWGRSSVGSFQRRWNGVLEPAGPSRRNELGCRCGSLITPSTISKYKAA